MTNQTIDILSPSGALIRKHTLSGNCTRRFSLMSEDSITLRFWTKEAMLFPIGTTAGDFIATQEQTGKWNAATGVWDHELKLEAYYRAWKNKLLRYVIPDADTAKETTFTLTATIDLHAQVIKNCLDLLGASYDGSPFHIETDDTVGSEAKLVRYENLSILGGIEAIAEAYECEWWVIGNAIHFGRCENPGREHEFEAGVNTSTISYSEGKTEAANRLYIYGSDRNLPPNYRKTDGNDTIGGVVLRRLMLPEGTPYLQTRPEIPEGEIVEKSVTLESVYPRTELTVSEEPETYTSQGEDEEENATTETYYRLKYGEEFRFSASYVLPGEELHIAFQSGLLNGMDFGARFNPKGLNEKNSDGTWNAEAQTIEVVANEDYGRKLPDEILKPQEGDEFILHGWDATKMDELGLIAKAEEELLNEGLKALEEHSKDLSTCTCPMAWDYMKPLFASNSQPKPGDRVRIIDVAHFGEGGRKSRIIGYEYKLDKPYAECTYTCGENVSVSRLKSLEQKIEGLAKTGSKVQMQNSLDFLSKRYNDRTPYKLAAEQGFEAGTYAEGISGARIDGRGNGEVESLRVRSYMQVAELIVNRQTTIEGDVLYTEGDTIESVTDNGDGTYTLKLHEEWEGYMTAQIENNVLRGIYNDISGQLSAVGGQHEAHGAVYYTSWMRVQAYDAAENTLDVVLYPDDQTPAGKNFAPRAMMKIARWGNSGSSDDPRYAMRQSCITVSSTEGRIMKLMNVTKPLIDIGNVAFVTGKLPQPVTEAAALEEDAEGTYVKHLVAETVTQVGHLGRPKATVVDRGPWALGERYWDGTELTEDGIYERSLTWRNGHGWLNDTGGTATEENAPTWRTAYWTHALGDPELKLDFEQADTLVDADNPRCPLDMRATYMGEDVTRSTAIYYDWERESERNGTRDTASDDLWNAGHKNAGPRLTLDGEDMNFQFGAPPEKLKFTVTATLHDPDNPNLQAQQAEFEMI